MESVRRPAAPQPRPRRLHLARGLGGAGGAARRRPVHGDRRGAGTGQRLHARRDRLPGALRRPDRLGHADPQSAGALAGPPRAARLRAARRARAGARRRLWRPLSRRRAGRGHADRGRPPQEPARRLGRSGPRGWTSCARSPTPRPDDAAAVVRLDAGPARRRVRRADAHPGGRDRPPRPWRPSAPSSGRCPASPCSTRRSWRRSRRRRQHRVHEAQGRVARPRGRERPDAWPLDDECERSAGAPASTPSATSSARRHVWGQTPVARHHRHTLGDGCYGSWPYAVEPHNSARRLRRRPPAALVATPAHASDPEQAAAARGAEGAARRPAKIMIETNVFALPGKSVTTRLPTHAPWGGGPNVLLVLDWREYRARPGCAWRCPTAPTAPAAGSERISCGSATTPWRVTVNRAAHLVTVYHNGRKERSFLAVIGAAATPTPRGLSRSTRSCRRPIPKGFLGPGRCT